MRDIVRFLFSAADQARIDVNSIQVQDAPYAAAPAPGSPYPQSLELSFKITNPQNGPIQIRPLFPGKLTFLVDDASPGVLPAPNAVEFTSTAYATWKTQGTVMVKVLPKAYQQILQLSSGLEVVPNTVWYAPIKISEEFLFQSLRNGLERATIPSSNGAGTIGTNHADWAKHAIAQFLAGRYAPQLRLKANADDDDVVAHPMPIVIMAADGNVTLTISTAVAQKPQDGEDDEFDKLVTNTPPTDPSHPRNGAIPVRHVYRSLRPHMIDAGVAAPIPNRILAAWPNAPRYFPIRFTRTWQPIENCSFLFPSNRANVRDDQGNALFEQRLPAHGVLYVVQQPTTPPQPNLDPPKIRLSVSGGLRFLDGATPNSWRVKADLTPLSYDFATVPVAHVIVRRTMSDEMLIERRYTPGGARCTYLSLRRSIRAFVDHRITGGQLNFNHTRTRASARRLMNEAWTGTQANANLVAHNRPAPSASPGIARRHFQPILEAFFPDIAPAQNIDGSTDRTVEFTEGRVAYELWQTVETVLFAEGTKRNFSDDHVGRGAAGALVAVDLAAAFHVDPVRNAGETDAAYFDRIVGEMLVGLVPGAALQFWSLSTDYENIKARTRGPTSIGHSPIFLKYRQDSNGNLTGIIVIDQFGETECPIIGNVGNRRLRWVNAREIWIAANWDE